MVEIRYTGDAPQSREPEQAGRRRHANPGRTARLYRGQAERDHGSLGGAAHSARQCLEQNLLVAAVKEKEMNSDSPTWMVHEIL